MTFQEFLVQSQFSARPVYQRIDGGVEIGEPTTKVYPAASAYIYPHHPLPVERDWAIMGLDDWQVSSVTGGSVWLVRRNIGIAPRPVRYSPYLDADDVQSYIMREVARVASR